MNCHTTKLYNAWAVNIIGSIMNTKTLMISLVHFLQENGKIYERNVLRVQENNIILNRKVGNDIGNSDWERFYYFYHLTYLKRSGRQGYLNKEFFRILSEKLFDSIMMVTAELHGNTIASSLFFFDSQTLYGRYWGCQEEHEFLHFEACYYQGIEFAIERGLNRFDPGAQGEHKIQRGFTPRITYSNHLIAKPKFSSAIENFLNEERPEILDYCNVAKNICHSKMKCLSCSIYLIFFHHSI